MPQQITNDVIANRSVTAINLASPISGAVDESQGNAIASAASINLTTATGNYVVISGTTTITSITLQQGARRVVRFSGALTLTNGGSLILPGGANITTAAGDCATFIGEAAGVVRCVQYQRADGTALITANPDLFFRLNTGLAGSNATGNQSLLGAGVTLAGSTVYEFEITATLLKTAGTTSHTVSLLFGGTATLNNIGYEIIANNSANAISAPGSNAAVSFAAATSANVITGAITQATQYVMLIAKGTVSVNAGGTLIPQYSLSAAPGGAYTTQIGSLMRLRVLGASGANNTSGTWA